MLTFQVYPIIYTFILSMYKPINIVKSEFVGFANFNRVFTNELFYKAIGNTFYIWIMNYIPQIVFALLLGVILTSTKIKGREILRTVYFLPNLVTASSIGVLFAVLLDWRFGTLNHALMKLHIISEPINYLSKGIIVQGSVSFIQWWQWFGYTMIIMMAGLNAISSELYEAAHIDGASRIQAFFKITLPLLKPTLLYVMITSLIGGLQIFDIPKVLTNGRGAPDNSILTMVLYLYNQAFKNFNLGYAAALAYALFIIILILSAFIFKFLGEKE
ncbi:sugar ABC transporter permease [Thiospirochaeta perfilievii]|uniref:Sugar ABC transporter permease n=2 Tax=Thiospirochaeta perfilievii TaxID=252967 RepID=A0A5C1QFS6_9SPIO|nr:sugar ABC transporter permease [Thiospirochaeta perfilievii]